MITKPKFEFTEKHMGLIEGLAQAHCSDEEISAKIGCSEATLKRHHAKLLAKSRKIGTSGIRRKQFELAMKGDKTMLIWVGKQICGQSDRSNIDQHITEKPTIVVHRFSDKTVYQTEFIEKEKK